jgi:hypothetical protein
MLASSESRVICSGYDGLCTLSGLYRDGVLPMEILIAHLMSSEIVDHVLSVLTTSPVALQSFRTYPGFIHNLIKAAAGTVHATIVLMDIARDSQGAEKILERPEWLLVPLPELTDTLRLFLVVFHHRALRNKLAAVPEVIPFLSGLTASGNPGVVCVVVTIIRRMPPVRPFVRAGAESPIVPQVFAFAQDSDDNVLLGAALVLADTVIRMGTAAHGILESEFIGFCTCVATCAKRDDDLARRACAVAAKMATIQKCCAKLVSLGMAGFFQEVHRNPRLGKAASRFIRNSSRWRKQQ